MVIVRALVANAEVKLLHALNLVTDVLELAHGTVSGKTLHDMGEGAGDSVSLLGVLKHCFVVKAGIGDEDNGDIQDVCILLVRLDVAIADRLKIDASLDSLL